MKRETEQERSEKLKASAVYLHTLYVCQLFPSAERDGEGGPVLSDAQTEGRWNLTREKIDFLGRDLGVIGKQNEGEQRGGSH